MEEPKLVLLESFTEELLNDESEDISGVVVITRSLSVSEGDPEAQETESFMEKKGANVSKQDEYHNVFTPFPKDPNCVHTCRMTKPRAPVKRADSTPLPASFGELIRHALTTKMYSRIGVEVIRRRVNVRGTHSHVYGDLCLHPETWENLHRLPKDARDEHSSSLRIPMESQKEVFVE